MYSGTRKEGIRCLTQNGTTVFTGINNSSPTNTLDVINTTTTAGILSLRNNSGVQVCSVSNTGLLTLTATGTATVLSIAGTTYTADSVTNTLSLTPSRTSITLTATGTATALTLAGTNYTADSLTNTLGLTPSRTSITLTASGVATALTLAGTAYSADSIAGALSLTPTRTSITLTATGTATALTLGGTNYSANTVANGLSATPSLTSLTLSATTTATALTIGGTAYSANTIANGFSATPSLTSLTLSATGAATALTVGGTAYSSDTVKAALGITATPTFTGNITLPSTYTAQTSTQLGYTNTLSLTGLTLSTYSTNTQNICGTTGTGRSISVVAGSYIVVWNYTVVPSNPSNPSYIYISTTEVAASQDSIYAPRIWFPTGDTVAKSGTLTRLYSGAACTFYPICMLGNGSSMNFTSQNNLSVMRIA